MDQYQHSYQKRCDRVQEKKEMLLRLLRTERYVSAENVGHLFGVSTLPSVYRFLAKMESEGFLRSAEIKLARPLRLWGLTPHGLAFCFDEDEPIRGAYTFQPSKVSLPYIAHYLAVQRLKISAEQKGMGRWVRLVSMPRKGVKIPDAVSQNLDGKVVAIEVERTVKSIKRYQEIVANYLVNMAAEGWDEVWYVMPDQAILKRVQTMISSLEQVHEMDLYGRLASFSQKDIQKVFKFIHFNEII